MADVPRTVGKGAMMTQYCAFLQKRKLALYQSTALPLLKELIG